MFGTSRRAERAEQSPMSVVPGDVDTDQQPPMAIPLRHFLFGLGLLVLGGVVGLLAVGGGYGGRLAHVHLLLAGWVCVTIMGAMTQFVPVWSGVALHSRRLARWQLRLVTVGLLGFAAAFLTGQFHALAGFGVVMLAGFWVFVYNLGRTLARARPLDITERHFALALGFFVLVTTLGLVLAVDLTVAIFDGFGLTRAGVVGAHATLAVFGAVLTTVVGALYQLATMFTQTELHGVDEWLRDGQQVAFPGGVLALAAGRLLTLEPLALAGGLLVTASLAGFAVVLARRLLETQVERTPMLSRYAVVAASLLLWAGWTSLAWIDDPLAGDRLLGPAGASHLLAAGVVGFVVFGTLYHIIPFIIWVRRYADLLGLEDVPLIDDLYNDRLAAADFWATLVGASLLVVASALDLPLAVTVTGGTLLLVGTLLFAGNLVVTIRRHSPQSMRGLVLPELFGGDDQSTTTDRATDEAGKAS
jgi:hypothetical protein